LDLQLSVQLVPVATKVLVRILMCTYNRINGAFDLYTFTKIYL
jgi:hypothetical protein